jgi:hypothetical protein
MMSARVLLGWAAVAVVVLHGTVLLRPGLLYDDFGILANSWTWAETEANLWVPQNEHTMPLGRVTTWLLIQVAPDGRWLAYLCDLQGVLGVLLTLPLVYLFVRRETDLQLVGVVAALLFAVTTVYQQAATWFAASFSILALATFLLGLLAAQAWRRTGRGLYLGACLLACALAPGWFASGILAGPLCFLYLLVPEREGPRFRWLSLAPLLGTGLFLALALPRVAATILHLPHFQGKTALEAFDPWVGLGYTCRSLVDNLFLGQFGVTLVCTPVWLVALVLPALVALLTVWLWPSRQVRLTVLGVALILTSYGLTYSARSGWDYVESGMFKHTWSRYHLFPQLGLCLLIAAGLPYWLPRLGTALRPEVAGITPTQARAVGLLLVILTVIHLPRGFFGTALGWEQWPGFAHIARVDARCREHGIARADALEALPPWQDFPEAGEFNAWKLLHGSATPSEVPPEEVRRLLLD